VAAAMPSSSTCTNLRQPQDVPVEDIIELLELQDTADGTIGSPGFGLSVEGMCGD
jgi:hypothetical protein